MKHADLMLALTQATFSSWDLSSKPSNPSKHKSTSKKVKAKRRKAVLKAHR